MGLCVTELEGRLECLTHSNSLIDRVFDSDSKEVLMVIGTGDSCYNKYKFHASPTPLPGYEEAGQGLPPYPTLRIQLSIR